MTDPRVDQMLSEVLALMQSSDIDHAEIILQDILIHDPFNTHALHFLGVCLCQKGDLKNGIQLIEKSISIDSTRFAPFLNLGKFYLDNSQLKHAVSSLDRACELNPHSFDAWFLSAKALFLSGDIVRALRSGKRALEIQPSSSKVLYLLGLIATESDKLLAISYYEKSIFLDASSRESLVNLANLYLHFGRFDDSVSSFQSALATDPECLQALGGLAYAYRKSSRFDESIATYNKLILLDPASIDSYFSLAELYKDKGCLEKAITFLNKALEFNSDHPEVLFMLSISLMDIGNIGDSLNVAKKYHRLRPFDPSLYERLGSTCERLSYRLNSKNLYLQAEILYKESLCVRPLIRSFRVVGDAKDFSDLSFSQLSRALPSNAHLIPSFSPSDPSANINLYYLHIPKCGGMRFALPLQECVRLYEDCILNGRLDSFVKTVAPDFTRLFSSRLSNKLQHKVLLELLSSQSGPCSVNWSLIMSHCPGFARDIQSHITNITGQVPIRVATYRDPKSRFLSALHYLYRESGGSLDKVRRCLDEKNLFLWNTIYHYLFDLDDSSSFPNNSPVVDYLFDLNDSGLFHQVQSYFLSANQLPNLIVSKRFNVTTSDFRIPSVDLDALLSDYSLSDFVSHDNSEAVNQLRCQQLPRAFDIQLATEQLHPLTVLVADETRQRTSRYVSKIIPTSDLANANGIHYLNSFFDGMNE